ncbi:MAG: hypothetical protein AB1656_08670 [Candidatus Omnitrophota bacterium]
MKKLYFINLFLFLAASIFLKISFADEKAYQEMLSQAKEVKPFIREKYIEEQTAYYKEEINKRLGGALDESGKNKLISDLLEPQLENHKLIKYQTNWYNLNFKKLLNVASICYAAADIQCVTPIYILADRFDFSSLGSSLITGDGLFNRKTTIRDFPVMYLAIQCSEKAIPALEHIIYNKELGLDLRLEAIATLRRIDEKKGVSAAMVVEDDFTGLMRDILTEFLKDPSPDVEPWAVVLRYDRQMRERVEKHVRRQAGDAKAK